MTLIPMFRLLFLLAITLPLVACQAPRECPWPGEERGNAGCLIVSGDAVLLVQQRGSQHWSTPGGTAEAGENARCTAARETREETGLEVVPGALVHRYDNGYHLFRCELAGPDGQAQYAVPLTAMAEVEAIAWRQPGQIRAEEWRYPQRWPHTQSLLLQATNPSE